MTKTPIERLVDALRATKGITVHEVLVPEQCALIEVDGVMQQVTMEPVNGTFT